jgi:hypothetical protein
MASKQELLRERIVQFASKHSLSETVNHFSAEEVPRRTIYHILSTFDARESTARQVGSGRKAQIMTNRRKIGLVQTMESQPMISVTQLASKYSCSRQYVQKTLKLLGFKCYSRQKAPKYSEEQIQLVKRHARWMHDRYKTETFVLDDEKYFGLSGPVNGTYYARERSNVADDVKFVQKAKFEQKLMVYLAISERGISEPLITESRIAVTQQTYTEQCLEGILLPFLRTYHADGNYVFWPDKASSHYARMAVNFMATNGIRFVPKEHNPTNLPQCRPIEDLWGYLTTIVYGNGWRAKTVKQLKRRILWAVRKVNRNAVQLSCSKIRKNLRVVYQEGPYAAQH